MPLVVVKGTLGMKHITKATQEDWTMNLVEHIEVLGHGAGVVAHIGEERELAMLYCYTK